MGLQRHDCQSSIPAEKTWGECIDTHSLTIVVIWNFSVRDQDGKEESWLVWGLSDKIGCEQMVYKWKSGSFPL